jgi:hypothetical protein
MAATNSGIIDIDVASSLTVTTNVTDAQNPRYRGWNLSSDGMWITYNSTNRVWLPSEYRPSCSAVLGREDRDWRRVWKGMDIRFQC